VQNGDARSAGIERVERARIGGDESAAVHGRVKPFARPRTRWRDAAKECWPERDGEGCNAGLRGIVLN